MISLSSSPITLSWLLLLVLTASSYHTALGADDGGVSLDRPFQSHAVFSKLPHIACVSLFFRKGRIGCGAAVRDDTDPLPIVHWELANKASGQFVAVFTDAEYTFANVQTLSGRNLLRGILVLNHTDSGDTTTTANSWTSPGPVYPRGENTPSEGFVGQTNGAYAWNPTGDSLILQDYFGVPTAYVARHDIASYAYGESRVEGNTVVARFNYYMGPASANSVDCLAWRNANGGDWSPTCQPVGGNSVLSYAGTPPPNNEDDTTAYSDFNQRDVVMLAASIDAAAVFQDAAVGANAAASNVMTLLLAAYHLGNKVSWEDLDGLTKQIAFGFFQGETFGYMGSRSFLKDKSYPGLNCQYKAGGGCTYPMRPSLNYENAGDIAAMLTVDQVGIYQTDKTLYVHTGGDDDNNYANVMLQFDGTAQSNADSLPPSPLTSLVELSEGNVGGAVITGYDEAFVNGGTYQSHHDTADNIDVTAIEHAALLLARAGLGAAILDDDGDYETAAATALTMLPEDEGSDAEYAALVETLYDCLFLDAFCKYFDKYTKTERGNERVRVGIDRGTHSYRATVGKVPNYYTSVYSVSNGQPVVFVNKEKSASYASYNDTVEGDVTYSVQPNALEAGIYGIMNDFLGKTVTDDDDGSSKATKCSTSGDCKNVQYCTSTASICTGGGRCVCGPSSFYHQALDEAIEAVPMTSGNYFRPVEGEAGVSPMYTEPNWSNSVGVTMFRQSNDDSGPWALGLGVAVVGVCCSLTLLLRGKMVKEKLY